MTLKDITTKSTTTTDIKEDTMTKVSLHSPQGTPATITGMCAGTSQHIHNRTVLHSPSRPLQAWIDCLPEGAVVTVTSKHSSNRLDYVTADPLP